MTELVYRDERGVRQRVDIPDEAELDLNHPAVRAAVKRIETIRSNRRAVAAREARPVSKRALNQPKPIAIQPKKGKWRAISSGQYKRRLKPHSSTEDRLYVPAALRHWRIVHGLSYREAQARIGYSERSCSWSHWESGYVVPAYATLLRIMAATGMGHWNDPTHRAGIDPALRLEADRAQWAAQMRARKTRRSKPKQPA